MNYYSNFCRDLLVNCSPHLKNMMEEIYKRDLKNMGLKKGDSAFDLGSVEKGILEIESADEMLDLMCDYNKINIVFNFWSERCAPCKAFAVTFEKLQKEFSKDFIFAKVNIDENKEIVQQYRISSVPTLLFLKNLTVRIKLSGVLSYEKLKKLLEKLKES